MIRDLFSHKIHSSGNDWPEKLAEIAAIFAEFEGHIFDRDAFEMRLQKISPRASYLAQSATSETTSEADTKQKRKDVSKFRDEISAYPAYLGIYYLEQSPGGWIVRLTETAKRYLVREEPDVGAFLRLQLPLLQYPNAMGAVYTSRSQKMHMQVKASNRTLAFIKEGFHLSPVRMIAIALKADAILREVNVLAARVSYNEILLLANNQSVNRNALPDIKDVITVLEEVRNGKQKFKGKYEKRFHLLKHTEIFSTERGIIRLRDGVTAADKSQLLKQLNAIARISNIFSGLDSCQCKKDLEEVAARSEWGCYFDGLKVLPAEIVDDLTRDAVLESALVLMPKIGVGEQITLPPAPETYLFRNRTGKPPAPKPFDRGRELADPDLTRIKRQKRNLAHKELVDKMESWLLYLGAQPQENDHIDLFAKIPGGGSFIFEMKSGGDSLLEQIRKGLSQLYEYRYRYQKVINDNHVSLCLVLPENPTNIPWITDYLCVDRDIRICWFENDSKPQWPTVCEESMAVLQKHSQSTVS